MQKLFFCNVHLDLFAILVETKQNKYPNQKTNLEILKAKIIIDLKDNYFDLLKCVKQVKSKLKFWGEIK